jgi:Tol biopolymer transport system component
MSAVWLRDGSVAFAVWRGNLYTVASSGGQPVPLLTIDRSKEIDVHQMAELPDGRLLVATHLTAKGSEEVYRVEVIGPSSRETAFDGALLPMASPLNNRLLMLRLDANPGIWAFQYTGKWPLRISDGTLVVPGATEFSASREGSLLYAFESRAVRMRELVWLDRAGQFTGQIGTEHQDLYGPALSPDERRVAFGAKSGDSQEIFVRDLTNDIQSRVTFGIEYQELPSWFAAGQRLIYSEVDARSNRIVAKNADGSGTRHEIALGLGPRLSPDGRQLIYVIDENGMRRLRYAAIGGDGTAGPPQKLFSGDPEPDIRYAKFSPDGRLIVYAERQAGDTLDHLFITRFPSGEGRWQVSSDGGRSPVWSRSGDLFFASGPPNGPKQLMMVSVQSGQRVSIGAPRKLFSLSEDLDFASFAPSFDVTADGKRLLFVRSRGTAGQSALRWVFAQNWLSELEH